MTLLLISLYFFIGILMYLICLVADGGNIYGCQKSPREHMITSILCIFFWPGLIGIMVVAVIIFFINYLIRG